jgi:hypothetical protein
MVLGGAPPRDAAKEDGDQKCPCLMCRFTRAVASDRIRRAGTPLRLFTRAGTATLDGFRPRLVAAGAEAGAHRSAA